MKIDGDHCLFADEERNIKIHILPETPHGAFIADRKFACKATNRGSRPESGKKFTL